MKPINDIDYKIAKSVLDYDPKTGIFKWKYRNDVPKEINTKFAGKKAGCINSAGYLVIRIKNRLYLGHRVAFLIMKERWPEFEVDHEDENKSNNKWFNLREASHAQNKFNCGISKRNKSGFKGVCWQKNMNKWRSQITFNGKHFELGFFSDPNKAHLAYKKKAEYLHKEFCRMR